MLVRMFVVLFTMTLCGCSTLVTVSVGKDTDRANCKPGDYVTRVYSGVTNDIRLSKDIPPGEELILATDFVFSLVADTVVLPYTIPTQIVWGNICPPPESKE